MLTPVLRPLTGTTFKAIRHLVEPGVLFADVGSTKRDVVMLAVLRERIGSWCLPTRLRRIGRHPACRRIAVQRLPGHHHPAAADHPGTGAATDVWSAIGAQAAKMTPETTTPRSPPS